MPDDLPTASPAGLTSADAAARLRSDGPNAVEDTERRSIFRIALSVLREPMLALLAAGGVVYVIIGEPRDSLVLVGLAMLSIVITVVQETRTERVLEALKALASPVARVIRDGTLRSIPTAEVVRGDLIALGEGDRVPADALVLSGDDIEADEALLTGESVPVRKRPAIEGSVVPGDAKPGGDDLPIVFAGSLLVRGKGLARVTATGARSAIGRIGQSLKDIETEAPRLQAQTRRIVFIFALLGGMVTVLAVLLYGVLRGEWLQAVLAGLALGMSMLPEEFPVVLTVFMAMGAWRISQHGVLTRHASAVEALGSTTVLCTDKTGTLTQNRMSVAELRLPTGDTFDPGDIQDGGPAALAELIAYGRLASAANPFDPMERALEELGERADSETPMTIARVHGLRPDLLAVTQVWQIGDDSGELLVATKGAPEAVGSLCGLDAAALAELRRAVDAMASRGMRVLAVAKARSRAEPAETPRDYRFELLGYIGFADPLRPTVRASVDQLRAAGIRVVMITGDYPATARAIAAEAGIDARNVLSGEELEALDDRALSDRARTTSVFARIMPEQKLSIVDALKASGEIVAMTGDGVNDAPSLKAAHIGVAMGKRGTDVARQAADIVLLEDDFGAIVSAVRLGRRIFDNVRKSMVFVMAVHVPIAGLALLPLLFGAPLILGPLHIALLEMVIDPTCTLVFEAEDEEDDVMRRGPRSPNESLLPSRLVVWAVIQGAVVLLCTAGIYVYDSWAGLDVDSTRTVTFLALILGIVALIFVNRSFSASPIAALTRRNLAVPIVVVAVGGVLATALSWDWARTLLDLGALSIQQIGLGVGCAAAVFLVLEAIKATIRKWIGGARSAAHDPARELLETSGYSGRR